MFCNTEQSRHFQKNISPFQIYAIEEKYITETWLYANLPKRVAVNLSLGFCERLIASHAGLVVKCFGPEPASLSCLGEAVLLEWGIELMYESAGVDDTALEDEVTEYREAVFWFGSTAFWCFRFSFLGKVNVFCKIF